MLFLFGCGNKEETQDVSVSTAVFHEDGSISVTTVESFSEDYYDEEELSAQIEREVEAYNAQSERIRDGKLTVEDGTARVTLRYSTAEDYEAFNGTAIYYGTVDGAQAAGYDLSPLLSAVSQADSGRILVQKDLETLSGNTLIVLTEPLCVETPYAILYVSDNVTVTGEQTADASGDVGEKSQAFLLLESAK